VSTHFAGQLAKHILPPPFDWVVIPSRAFAIAKYPITNAQFARFMRAGGYRVRRWWSDAGWHYHRKHIWVTPRYWDEPTWNQPDQPVVGVSWYEAMAFCGWLSEVTEKKITLPTEAQWRYAAQGNDGRKFPWGDEWDYTRCNNSGGLQFLKPLSNLPPGHGERTTAVNAYEGRGNSPFGVVDMAGNAAEWCLTHYEASATNIGNYVKEYVLRGGAWYNRSVYFHCQYQFRYVPEFRYNFTGLRPVLLPDGVG